MVKLNKNKFRKAMEKSFGNITIIAERLNVSRQSIYVFLDKNLDIKEEFNLEREKILDIGENVLFSHIINEKSLDATKYLLSTRGKSRGYVTKQEVEHSGSLTWDKINKELEELEKDNDK